MRTAWPAVPSAAASSQVWGAPDGAASLNDSNHVQCASATALSDADHPDTGTGYTDPSGKKFYFIGTYNSFVIETLNSALDKLTLAYALTEDAKYSAKAALILDELARIYPTSETGSVDCPLHAPPSGRFNRPWYQVARVLTKYANHL